MLFFVKVCIKLDQFHIDCTGQYKGLRQAKGPSIS